MTAVLSPLCRISIAIGSSILALHLIGLPTLVYSDSTTKKLNRCPLRPSSDVVRPPLVLGHRGASFHLPEHTLPAYRLALELEADYIEPDLVPCKDGTLVAVHSADLNVTSNVHTYNNGEFQGKARQSEANDNKWGYYVHDFTWEEVQKLSVRQRVSESGSRTDRFDYAFGIPSIGQIVDLVHDWNTRELPLIGRPGKTGGVPGIFAELKHSHFFQEDANLTIADLFLDELARHPKASELLFDHITLCDNLKHDEYRVPPLVVHSFELDVLEYLRKRFKERWMEFVEEDALLSSGVVTNSTEEDDEVDHPWIPPLVFLANTDYCQTTDFWFKVAGSHVSGVGVNKDCLLPSVDDIASNNVAGIERAKRKAREWVVKAHSERLAVYPWTVRPELEKLTHVGGVPDIFSSVKEELQYYYCELKVDGAWAEDVITAQMVGAEGCDGYSSEESAPEVGRKGPVCVEEVRSLWLLGLSFLAVGAFAGTIFTCIISTGLTKRGYCVGAIGATQMRSSRLPQIDDDDDDDNDII